MRDLFGDFERKVYAAYRWEPWVTPDGNPVTAPAAVLEELEARATSTAASRSPVAPSPSPAATEPLSAEEHEDERDAEVDAPRPVTQTQRTAAWAKEHKRYTHLAQRTGPVLTRADTDQWTTYRPLDREHSGLFHEFARVDVHETKAILRFASRYGDLGSSHSRQRLPVRRRDGRLTHRPGVIGESHLTWATEIARLREAIHLSQHGNTPEDRWRLIWLSRPYLADIHGGLALDPAGTLRFTITPRGLLSVLWLQFALALTQGKRFVDCKFCGRPFEISTDAFRSHREFCTGMCKTLDYRKRMRDARALAEAGESVVTIAKKIDTARDTVKRWLGRTRTHQRGKR
jgi:endogenous inhibitor of DNA gyrase (YacG/DUF329 family)